MLSTGAVSFILRALEGCSNGKRVKELENEVLEHRLAEEAIDSDLEEPRQRNAEIRPLLESTRNVFEYHGFEASARALFNTCKGLMGPLPDTCV